MKTKVQFFLLMLMSFAICSCGPSKFITEVNSTTIYLYKIGKDTLNKIDFYSPMDKDILLKPCPKAQGVETPKRALAINNEDILIPKGTKGQYAPMNDTATRGVTDSLRVSFDDGKSLLWIAGKDGSYFLYGGNNGIILYGDKEYHIDGFVKGDRSFKLYYEYYFKNSTRIVKGNKK